MDPGAGLAARHGGPDAEEGAQAFATPAGFTAAVQPHVPVMQAVARRLAPGTADDVTQEALLAAWRYRHTFEPRAGSLRGWLAAITVRECRKDAGRRWRWQRLVDRAGREVQVVGAHSPREGQDDTFLAVDAAVARLSRRQREVVELHYFADLSVEDVAFALRLAGGTVKSTLADARKKIREYLEAGEDRGRR